VGETISQIVSKLEAEWPSWQIWYVPKAIGGMIWCARRWGDETHVLNADSPDGLAELLEAEAER
jgi:hypothetical protein